MSNNLSKTNFFFYKNYRNKSNLQKISRNFSFQEGELYVDYYNSNTNSLIIGNQSKQCIIGLVATFNISFYEVLQKLNNNKSNGFNKLKYRVETVDIKIKDGVISCNIIY
tara:strand:- start:2091 stop:2420 length:330 start_codon:yes stop_codon:yes gene_type:complete